MTDVFDDDTKLQIEAGQFFFRKKNRKNHQCQHCGSPLWAVLETDRQSRWVKTPNYGYVYRELAREHLDLLYRKIMAKSERSGNEPVFPKEYYDIKAIVDEPNIIVKPVGARRDCSLSMYISKKNAR